VFGADSLVGSHFVEQTRHRVTSAGRVDPRTMGIPSARFHPIDLKEVDRIRRLVRETSPEVVVNFAAATEVDKVEQERPAGDPTEAEGPTFSINVLAPSVMAKAARERGIQFVHLSTDFVFDGISGPYAESAPPSPWSSRLGWYGWTKGEGERRLLEADPTAAIVRISYPYRSRFPGKTDFARNIITRRQAGMLPPLFTDQVITPTWIPDVSRALEYIIERREMGCFHVASPERTSPWEFGESLVGALEGSAPQLPKGSMKEYLARPGVTPRPRQGGLTVDRLPAGGLALTSWREGILEFQKGGGGA
jgi:dTDP-4-dehydrorhamnose reductase